MDVTSELKAVFAENDTKMWRDAYVSLLHKYWLARAEICRRVSVINYLESHKYSKMGEIEMEIKLAKAEDRCLMRAAEFQNI